ncbi:MAG: hypothetical protein VYB37_04890 [Pseudomonadota bacterium]|nr:hypothetical protein [Pseudomonadota bacterium]
MQSTTEKLTRQLLAGLFVNLTVAVVVANAMFYLVGRCSGARNLDIAYDDT